MTFKTKRNILYWAALSLFTSCIKNDIPFPYIEGVIQSFEVYDMQGDAKIDAQRRLVEITVGEDAVLSELPVTKLVANTESQILPDAAACINASQFPDYSFTSLNDLPANANTSMNMSQPVSILLKTYQDYLWTVKVTQVIDRTIEVEHQIGEAQFDVPNKRAIVYVDKDCRLDDVHILQMNLEGKRATVSPDPATVTNFTRSRSFNFTKNGKPVGTWIVDIQPTDISGTTGSVEAWATKATLFGGMKSGTTPTVEYKPTTSSAWNTLDAASVTILTSSTFRAEVTGLTDGTEYEWRVVAEGNASPSATFTTEKIVSVPNLNFDTWTRDGKNWYANGVADNYDDPNAYWASGNEGVTSTLAGGHESITEPVEGRDAYKGKAAKLHSLTGVTLVGAAAGNLFIGKYKTNMSNPSSSPTFGRPFTGARPTRMKGYYKYTPMPITHHGTIPNSPMGTDQCHIYIKLWDANGNLFGYGEFIGSEKVTEYTEFQFDIEYKDKKAKPAMMTIVATSSRYGGEFSGSRVSGQVGAGSTLWVDEFELLYD